MKLTTVVMLLFSSLVASEQHVFGKSKIPGESPFHNCAASDGILAIDYLNLTPNPPQPGKTVTIKAEGTLSQDVGKGAYAKVTVKYGLIQLLSTTADLCEQAANADLNCPIPKGKFTLTTDVTLPSAIPPGIYNIAADVYSDDDEQITCLFGSFNFPRPS